MASSRNSRGKGARGVDKRPKKKGAKNHCTGRVAKQYFYDKQKEQQSDPYDPSLVKTIKTLYQETVTTSRKKVLKLKIFGDNKNTANIPNKYAFDISVYQWLASPVNKGYLLSENEKFLTEQFGENALTDYSVPSKMRVATAPKSIPSREFEHYIFIHDDNFYEAMVNAPKIPVEDWKRVENKHGGNRYARRVIMNIDGKILLGEMIKFETNQPTFICPDKKSGSSLAFNVFFRGIQDAKFNVERWDYKPFSIHRNKLDAKGRFSVYGNIPNNTTYSHRHMFTLKQRLVFGKNNSADVKPLPINMSRKKEYVYRSFDEFYDDFNKRTNFVEAKVKLYELEHDSLTQIGEKYCPRYNSVEKRVEHIPQGFYNVAAEAIANKKIDIKEWKGKKTTKSTKSPTTTTTTQVEPSENLELKSEEKQQ